MTSINTLEDLSMAFDLTIAVAEGVIMDLECSAEGLTLTCDFIWCGFGVYSIDFFAWILYSTLLWTHFEHVFYQGLLELSLKWNLLKISLSENHLFFLEIWWDLVHKEITPSLSPSLWNDPAHSDNVDRLQGFFMAFCWLDKGPLSPLLSNIFLFFNPKFPLLI